MESLLWAPIVRYYMCMYQCSFASKQEREPVAFYSRDQEVPFPIGVRREEAAWQHIYTKDAA